MAKKDDIEKFRQSFNRLTGNPKFSDALADLEDQQQFNEARANPKEHFKKKGLDFPDEADLRVVPGSVCIQGTLWGVTFSICF